MALNLAAAAHQVPCQREGDSAVADGGANEPNDHDDAELLELFELRDIMDGDCGTDATDCRKIQADQQCTWVECEKGVQNDVDPVMTMKVTSHQFPVNTFTRHAKKS